MVCNMIWEWNSLSQSWKAAIQLNQAGGATFAPFTAMRFEFATPSRNHWRTTRHVRPLKRSWLQYILSSTIPSHTTKSTGSSANILALPFWAVSWSWRYNDAFCHGP